MDTKQNSLVLAPIILATLILLAGSLATGQLDFRALQQELAAGDERPEFDPAYLYARAYQLYERDERPLAKEIARRLTYLKPDHKDARRLLAAIALRDRDYPAALSECRKLLEMDPTDMTARLSMGSALRGQGKDEEARRLFEEVLSSPLSEDRHREEAQAHLSELGQEAVTP